MHLSAHSAHKHLSFRGRA